MQIRDHKAIIDLWESIPAFASAVDKPLGNVHGWHRRNSIPRGWYQDVLRAAEQDGMPVTLELLEATSPDVWRSAGMRDEIRRLGAVVAKMKNRISLLHRRHYAAAALRGEKGLPDLSAVEASLGRLGQDLFNVASEFTSTTEDRTC